MYIIIIKKNHLWDHCAQIIVQLTFSFFILPWRTSHICVKINIGPYNGCTIFHCVDGLWFFFLPRSLMTNMYTVSWLFTITKNASSSIFFHVSLFISISTVSSYIHSIRYRLCWPWTTFLAGSVQVCFILSEHFNICQNHKKEEFFYLFSHWKIFSWAPTMCQEYVLGYGKHGGQKAKWQSLSQWSSWSRWRDKHSVITLR